MAAAATAIQCDTDLLHSCKLVHTTPKQPVQSTGQPIVEQPTLPNTIDVGHRVCFSNNAEDAA